MRSGTRFQDVRSSWNRMTSRELRKGRDRPPRFGREPTAIVDEILPGSLPPAWISMLTKQTPISVCTPGQRGVGDDCRGLRFHPGSGGCVLELCLDEGTEVVCWTRPIQANPYG
jgi:hypothetical protein